MFTINWINVKSALVYGVLSALLAMGIYAIGVNDVFGLNWKEVVNAGVFGLLTVLVSLIKNLLTTGGGDFLGLIKVIPPTE
jgi:hypothetical protein